MILYLRKNIVNVHLAVGIFNNMGIDKHGQYNAGYVR